MFSKAVIVLLSCTQVALGLASSEAGNTDGKRYTFENNPDGLRIELFSDTVISNSLLGYSKKYNESKYTEDINLIYDYMTNPQDKDMRVVPSENQFTFGEKIQNDEAIAPRPYYNSADGVLNNSHEKSRTVVNITRIVLKRITKSGNDLEKTLEQYGYPKVPQDNLNGIQLTLLTELRLNVESLKSVVQDLESILANHGEDFSNTKDNVKRIGMLNLQELVSYTASAMKFVRGSWLTYKRFFAVSS